MVVTFFRNWNFY